MGQDERKVTWVEYQQRNYVSFDRQNTDLKNVSDLSTELEMSIKLRVMIRACKA